MPVLGTTATATVVVMLTAAKVVTETAVDAPTVWLEGQRDRTTQCIPREPGHLAACRFEMRSTIV